MKLYKDLYNKFWIENETSPSGIYSITFSEDNSICVIRNIRSGLIRYNGLVTGLKKENGTNYTNRVDLENAVSDFFRKASTAPIAGTRGLEQYSTLINLPTVGSDSVVYYTIDTKLLYIWNGTTYDAVPEQEISDYVTVVANYAALPNPVTVTGKFYWCSNSQGTSWLPGTIGGTYYNSGLYYSNGTSWEYLNVPHQATQNEVNTGTNTDKFVTPSTLANSNVILNAVSNDKKVTTLTTDGGQLTGFVDPIAVNVSYNGVTRKITLTGDIRAAYKGIPMTEIIPSFISGWQSEAHDITDGGYFLYFNGTNFVWSAVAWDFKQLMIASVYRDGVNFCLRECHGLMDWQSHESNHNNIGTYLKSGADVSGFILNSDVATNRRPLISQALVYDEDLPSILPQLTNGLYSRLFLDGANNANLENDKTDIVEYTAGNRFTYNLFTGGVWTKATAANNQYAKVFLMAVPVTSDADCQKNRYIWIMPQTVNATLTTIQNLTPANLNLGQISTALAEYVFVQEFIIRATSSGWTIVSTSKLTGNKRFQITASGALATSHTALLDKNAEPTFQHLDTTTEKTTPIDADSFGLWDSVTSTFKRLSVANMLTWFRGLPHTFTQLISFSGGVKTDTIRPVNTFTGVTVRNTENTTDIFKVDTFNNKVDLAKVRFTQNQNKTTQPELYMNNDNLFFRNKQLNSYIERTIPNVSSAVADYGKCYEIGTFSFGSLQGAFKIDVILDGNACGQSSTTFLNSTYAFDYLQFYKTSITQKDNIWINLQSVIESPRHAFNNTNAWIIQAKINTNSVSFRLKINEGNGYQSFIATARIKIYHSDDFINSSYTELTGVVVDTTTYQTLPSILSAISGVSLIQNNLEVVGYLETNSWVYLNHNIHTGDAVGDRRYKVVNSVLVTQGCTVANATRGSGTWVNVGVQLSDNTATASLYFEGCKRYRKDSNNSYEETCMQTGATSYAWAIIKQNTW